MANPPKHSFPHEARMLQQIHRKKRMSGKHSAFCFSKAVLDSGSPPSSAGRGLRRLVEVTGCILNPGHVQRPARPNTRQVNALREATRTLSFETSTCCRIVHDLLLTRAVLRACRQHACWSVFQLYKIL